MKHRQYFYSILLAVIFAASFFVDQYFFLVYCQTVLLTVMTLDKLGKGIVLRELIAFHTTMICLLLPILGYTLYNQHNLLALIWVRYMPIESERYFGFSLPAISAFCFSLTLPFSSKTEYDYGKGLSNVMDIIRKELKSFSRVGIYLMVFGVIMLYFSTRVSVSLQFLFNLFWMASFSGFLYVFYSSTIKYRKTILLLFVLFVLVYSLNLGMFTIVAYMGMLLFSFVFLGNKLSFLRKVIYFVTALFILLIIQSVKPAFRQKTWNENYEGNRLSLFYNLIAEKVSEGQLFNENAFFPIYYRANQGFNVALVMGRIPKIKPYDGGENLAINLLSSIVPRFLWPDKPEAGGKFNMKHYAGYNLVGYSTNIGPLGEAYGSFGVSGGIAYMFLLGLFIRYAYSLVFKLAKKIPALLLWIPVLFFQVTYSAEADTLQIMNSLIKASFFVFLFYSIIPGIFLKKQVFDTRKMAIRRNALNAVPNQSPI